MSFASVSMAEVESESLPSLGREGVVRSKTLCFFFFLMEQERALGVRTTDDRAWVLRRACSS